MSGDGGVSPGEAVDAGVDVDGGAVAVVDDSEVAVIVPWPFGATGANASAPGEDDEAAAATRNTDNAKRFMIDQAF